jgi:hypothetical protein
MQTSLNPQMNADERGWGQAFDIHSRQWIQHGKAHLALGVICVHLRSSADHGLIRS